MSPRTVLALLWLAAVALTILFAWLVSLAGPGFWMVLSIAFGLEFTVVVFAVGPTGFIARAFEKGPVSLF